jgi:hypothetical protein
MLSLLLAADSLSTVVVTILIVFLIAFVVVITFATPVVGIAVILLEGP